MSNGTPLPQPNIDKLLSTAAALATQMQHEYISLEHIAMILLDDDVVSKAVEGCGANLSNIRGEIMAALQEDAEP